MADTITFTELGLSGTNLVVQTEPKKFVKRQMANSSNIEWTNATGVAGNPTADLSNTGAVAGTYGAANETVIVTSDGKGRITSISDTSIQISESQVTNLVTDLANKQPLDTILTEIADLTTDGAIVKTGASTVVTQEILSTDGTPAGESSNIVGRDANGNTAINNIVFNIDFRNAIGTPITLNANSGRIQEFDGGSTPTDILMPNATTLLPEWSFEIHNFSSAVVSIKDNLGGAICTLPVGCIVTVVCLVTATAGGTWEFIVGTTQDLTSGNVVYAQNEGFLTSQPPAALTKVDDTNVTLTLGGSPTTALLQSVSLTLGWTGQSSVPRGGTGFGSTTAYGLIAGGTTSTGNLQNTGTGATGTILQGQGSSALPTFSTATYPSTTTANQILYSSSNNVIAGLTSGNNGVLITSGAGVPSISSTLPSAVQGNITSTGTLGSLTVTGNINNTALTASRVTVTDSSKNLTSASYSSVGTWVLIQSQTAANSTSIDFTTGLTAYDLLRFEYVGVRPGVAGNVLLQMLVSNNGGSSYITSNYKSGLQVFSFNSATPSNSNLTTAMQISGNYTTTAGEFGSGHVYIAKLASLNFNAWGDALLFSSTAPFREFFQGTNTANSDCNAVRFNFSGGSAQIASGTFSVYGLVQ